jgi:hypothetical protein
MSPFKPKPQPQLAVKRVWRISASAPMGEWVDNPALKAPKPAPVPVPPKSADPLPEVSYGSWVTSSYDLLDGTDVTEDPDTVPGELFDELFAPRPNNIKAPRT